MKDGNIIYIYKQVTHILSLLFCFGQEEQSVQSQDTEHILYSLRQSWSYFTVSGLKLVQTVCGLAQSDQN